MPPFYSDSNFTIHEEPNGYRVTLTPLESLDRQKQIITPKRAILRSPLGEYLREQRLLRPSQEMAGVSTSIPEMARDTHLHPAHISHVETGRCHPRRVTCDTIARFLGVDKEELWQRCQESKGAFGRKKSTEVGPRSGEISARLSLTLRRGDVLWLDSVRGDTPRATLLARLVRQARHKEETRSCRVK